VFTGPAEIADIAYHNKAVVYDILFKATAETLITIAADPKHLGARIGITAVLHTWGSALTHHPHLHCIVPGGGISLDGGRWIPCRPNFLLSVRVLSRLFRRLFLEKLVAAHDAGRLSFFNELAPLTDRDAFDAHVAPLLKLDWVVYAKPPFDGPERVLKYLARYTHRIAISNHRLLHVDDEAVTLRYKDYRSRRSRSLTLPLAEFTRRFLLHVLPKGFVRIRHYGFLANGCRQRLLACCRDALGQPERTPVSAESQPKTDHDPLFDLLPLTLTLCPNCGRGPLRCVEVLGRPPPHRVRVHRVAA